MSELLDCPFCGGTAEMDTQQPYVSLYGGYRGKRVAIYCTECPADMGICLEDIPEVPLEAVVDLVEEKWNTRPASPCGNKGDGG